MAESAGSNVEIAKHLSEHHSHAPASVGHEILEILEALLLAIVAVTTAWSGYQATLWTGHQARLYAEAGRLRVEAQAAATYANQERLYNAMTIMEWIKAEAHGDRKLTEVFERRILPEFRPAFEAWKKIDPLHNPAAPAGPQLMSEYRSVKAERAIALDSQADKIFEEGSEAIRLSDQYVRATVILATVLLLVAISQKFKTRAVRIGLLATALILLCLPIYNILTLPRA